MQSFTRVLTLAFNSLPLPHRVMLVALLFITLIIGFWQPYQEPVMSSFPEAQRQNVPAELPKNSEPIDQPALEDVQPWDDLDDKTTQAVNSQDYVVSSGDNLHNILQQYGIASEDIALLSKADKALRNLQIGQKLNWTLDDQGALQQVSWQMSQRETRHYQRLDGAFTMNSVVQRGEWQQQVLSGRLNGSFASSARTAGLSSSEINAVVQALQWQLDFRKLQKDDAFAVLLSGEMLVGQRQQSRVLAARLRSGSKDYYAFLADDGRYYDREGNGLARGFLRFPTARQYRVSSGFNLRRLHPITGKVAPHKGVDFAMPTGTPILAVGDGEVTEAKYSDTAGYYLAIRHGRTYTTRYLHLQKMLVNAGQKVKRGERIALSGNTGRSTGGHLHYELWINRQPVDPLTASLPRTEGLTGKDKRDYLARVETISKQLHFE